MRGRDYFAEFAGTFLLLLIGLSAVVLNFARTSPIPRWLPDGNLRRLLTGMIFAGGATAAHAVRLMWGHLATDVDLGTTIPGRGGWPASFAAEIAITFMLVTLILRFVDEPRLQRFTPAAAGALVAFLVFVEAPVSGTSLNPGPEPRPRLGRRHVLGNLDLRGGAAPWGPPRGRRLPAPESLREVREACPLGQICMPVHRLRIHAPGEAAAGCASSPRS